MSRLIVAALALSALVACDAKEAPDSDGDGLTDEVELGLGTDPNNVDSDADRIADADEAAVGTDPARADSDGDGYADGDEIAAGSDPTDADVRIYLGGWPYNYEKDAIEAADWSGRAEAKGGVPRLLGIDQFGEEVDLFDFAGHGKPIVVDLAAVWCGPCKAFASMMAHEVDEGGASDTFRDQIDAGKAYYITLLYQNNMGDDTDAADVERWDFKYPNENIAVLTDPGQQMGNFIYPPYIPSLSLINDDMTWAVVDNEEMVMAVVNSLE